ncbi:MAG: hypothetical protein RI897_635 [Verrucomicrobiota bacterium]
MRAFADLFLALDRTTRTSEKVALLEAYFGAVAPEDGVWALWFLCGQRLKRVVKTGQLREWVAAESGLPLWLVEESYEHVGDLAETLALLLPEGEGGEVPGVGRLVTERLLPLAGLSEVGQRELLRETWGLLDSTQRFLWNKLITGGFRVGVSRALVVRALARVAGVEASVMSHRLLGKWEPTAQQYVRMISGEVVGDDSARPYPFYLASPLEGDVEQLGEAGGWQVEWKWDGIRAQLIRRGGEVVLWSRGEEIVTGGFPEVVAAGMALPEGIVLDGELLAWKGDGPLAFGELQRRLNRKTAGAGLCREVPVVFMAYDLLEYGGVDVRGWQLRERRRVLEAVVGGAIELGGVAGVGEGEVQLDLFGGEGERVQGMALRLSLVEEVSGWEEVRCLKAESRERGVEGVMLKQLDSVYGVGRQRGAWWKWKVDPLTCDVVLVAAQPGHGRRATIYSDYTLAVWDEGDLLTVAKAYSGLSDAEMDEVDAYVRANITGRFGPVRSVKPELVFEIAFEGVGLSTRHKSGVALRFPRIVRWRRDKRADEADTLDFLRGLCG